MFDLNSEVVRLTCPIGVAVDQFGREGTGVELPRGEDDLRILNHMGLRSVVLDRFVTVANPDDPCDVADQVVLGQVSILTIGYIHDEIHGTDAEL